MQYKIVDKKKFALFVFVIIVLAGGVCFGGYKLFKKYYHPELTLSGAAKIGEQKTMQVLVQIFEPKGNPEAIKGSYKRGDIIQLADENKKWSTAEQEGFLIIKIKITQAQADLLTQSLEKSTGKKQEDGQVEKEQLQLRRFSVDLGKIGVSPDEQKGRMVDKIFEWEDVIKEKQMNAN